MDSEKTAAQKELVTALTEKMHELENYRTYFSKIVMDENNTTSVALKERVQKTLLLLKDYLRVKRDELKVQDALWLEYQLDDLEAELCQSPK